MSDLLQSALPGATYSGIVALREVGLVGMITLRADLSDAGNAAAVRAVTGCDIPQTRALSGQHGGTQVAWMSPDELLILCPHAQADAMVSALTEAFGEAHHLAVNVSDARAVFEMSGAAWRDVLAKVTPADLSRDAFGPGDMRRTRLAQVPAALWISGEDSVRVVCFRSVAQYVFDLLSVSAKPGGEVGYH